MNSKSIFKLINIKNNLLATLSYDEDPVNPLDWDPLTHYYFDGAVDGIVDELFAGKKEAYEEFFNKFTNTKDLFENLENIGKKKGKFVFPITKYEHSAVKYYVGIDDGWDYSVVGCAIVFKKDENGNETTKNKALKFVQTTLDNYTDYINGDVYEVSLYSLTLSGEISEHVDSIGDIYYSNIHLSNYIQDDVDKTAILEGLRQLEYETLESDWYSVHEEIKSFYYVGK